MDYMFELEYDGVYYQIDVEYRVERDRQDHEFGWRRLELVVPVKWLASCDGAYVSVIDEKLKAQIWRECDSYADVAFERNGYID